jgi:hypothetical protein
MKAFVQGQLLPDFLCHKYKNQTVTLAIKIENNTSYYCAKWCELSQRHRLRCVEASTNAILLKIDRVIPN